MTSPMLSIDADEALLELLGLLGKIPNDVKGVNINDNSPNISSIEQQCEQKRRLMNILTVEEDEDICSGKKENYSLCTQQALVTSTKLLERLLSLKTRQNRDLIVTPINHLLPRHCSRHQVAPCNSFALSIKNFLSSEECQALIELSHQSNPKYVTEASHVAPDGSHYTVPIQNPNPHKLAVMEQGDIIHGLWSRLSPFLIRKNIKRSSERTSVLEKVLFEGRKRWGPCRGLNPRLRILRYDAKDGDLFEPHFDATTVVGRHTSAWTVLIYLNGSSECCAESRSQSHADNFPDSNCCRDQSFHGGETCFLNHGTFATAKKVANDVALQNKSAEGESSMVLNEFYCIRPETGQAIVFEHDLFHTGLPLTNGTKYVLRTDVLFDTKALDSIMESKEMEEGCSDDGETCSVRSNLPNCSAEPFEGMESVQTVADLCACLKVGEKDQDILEAMDLLRISIQTFLLPGKSVLVALLCDSGLAQTTAEQLILKAQDFVSNR